MPKKWLDLEDVAERADRSSRSIQRAVKDGRFPTPARTDPSTRKKQWLASEVSAHVNQAEKERQEWSKGLERAAESLQQAPGPAYLSGPPADWYDEQIEALRDSTTAIPVWKSQELKRRGITAKSNTTSEDRGSLNTFLHELDRWVAEHGHAIVPQHHFTTLPDGEPYPLGRYVSLYRVAYNRGELSNVTVRKIGERTGWAWDYHDKRWNDRLDDVLTRWPDDLTQKDQVWLSSQRGRFDSLRPEWQRRLTQVPGLVESKRMTRVEEFVEAAQAWLKANPGYDLSSLQYRSKVEVRGVSVPVGKRAMYYRRRFAGLESTRPLSAAEVRAIESLPGWSWEYKRAGGGQNTRFGGTPPDSFHKAQKIEADRARNVKTR